MAKQAGAFLTIGELANALGVPQHVLRYWETRFPQLRPLQRSGNRRYYRPEDVAMARSIHRLLHTEGFTMRGAQRALAEEAGGNERGKGGAAAQMRERDTAAPADFDGLNDKRQLIARLGRLRQTLTHLLDEE